MTFQALVNETRRLRAQVDTMYSKERVKEIVEEAFVLGFHCGAKDSRRLLIDVAWSDLDTDLTDVVHIEAKKYAQVLVK